MKVRVPILLYHSVSLDAAPGYRIWAVSPETFATHMAYLNDCEYTPITVTQLVNAISQRMVRLPVRPVVITFDDGFADFHAGALPILKSHDFAATLYVAAGLIGDAGRWLRREGEGKRPMLTWVQLANIAASGIEIGAHSLTHPQLDMLPSATAWEEIIGAKRVLEAGLGTEVTSFAYPYGYYSRPVRRMVQQAGYSSACAVKHAVCTTADDRFALPRIQIVADTTTGQLAGVLTGRGLPVAPHVRAVTRRFVHRSAARLKSHLRLEASAD